MDKNDKIQQTPECKLVIKKYMRKMKECRPFAKHFRKTVKNGQTAERKLVAKTTQEKNHFTFTSDLKY